jgi:ankyrin repeat protein
MAIDIENLEMVQFTLSRGADPNLNHTMNNSSALEFAAVRTSISIIEALLRAGSVFKGRETLQNAAYYENEDMVAYLLDQGIAIDEIPNDADITDSQRARGLKTALCEAAGQGHTEVVKLLLERGANHSVRDTNGRSALDLAEAGGHESCAMILREWSKSR